MTTAQWRAPHQCDDCGCVGTEEPCWQCGSIHLSYHPWSYTGGHRHDPTVRSLYVPGMGRTDFDQAEMDEPPPWKHERAESGRRGPGGGSVTPELHERAATPST